MGVKLSEMEKAMTVVIIFKSGTKVCIDVPNEFEFVDTVGKYMTERQLVKPLPQAYPYHYTGGCIDLADVSFITYGAGVNKIYEDQ